MARCRDATRRDNAAVAARIGVRGGGTSHHHKAPAANIDELKKIVAQRHIPLERLLDRLECFGGFAAAAGALRRELEAIK